MPPLRRLRRATTTEREQPPPEFGYEKGAGSRGRDDVHEPAGRHGCFDANGDLPARPPGGNDVPEERPCGQYDPRRLSMEKFGPQAPGDLQCDVRTQPGRAQLWQTIKERQPRITWVSVGLIAFMPRPREHLEAHQIKNLERARRREAKALQEIVEMMVDCAGRGKDFVWELPAEARVQNTSFMQRLLEGMNGINCKLYDLLRGRLRLPAESIRELCVETVAVFNYKP